MLENQNFNLTIDHYVNLQQGDAKLQHSIFVQYANRFVVIIQQQYAISLEDAQEIVSGSFAKFFRRVLSKEVEFENLQGYFYTILKHDCLKLLERKKQEKLRQEQLHAQPLFADSNDEMGEKLNRAFKKLCEDCQKLLSAFYWEGKAHRKISLELGISEDASKQRKSECMKQLRGFLLNN